MHFRYFQLLHSLPPGWRQSVLDDIASADDVVPMQEILQCTKLIPIEKLILKQIYQILIRKRAHTPTSKTYYATKFPSIENSWLKIYMMPRKITKNAYDRIFQYIILSNIFLGNPTLVCALSVEMWTKI